MVGIATVVVTGVTCAGEDLSDSDLELSFFSDSCWLFSAFLAKSLFSSFNCSKEINWSVVALLITAEY